MTLPAPILDYAPGTPAFVQSIFMVQLSTGAANPNGDFSSWADVIGYNTLNDSASFGTTQGVPAHTPAMSSILSDVGDGWNATPSYFTRGKCRDTSLGGNDAINCLPQFNETDDVSEHPFLQIRGQANTGMGRVYSEVYDDQQVIMYMTFGVPKYNNLTNFYTGAVLANLAKLMNDGVNPIGSLLGNLTGATLATAIKMPTLPLAFIAKIFGSGLQNVQITKYYEFKSAMPLYYRAVDSMIMHLTINMGLNRDNVITPGSQGVGADGTISATPQEQAAGSLLNANGTQGSGLPEIFEKYGPSIYKILIKKDLYDSATPPNLNSIQDSDAALLATEDLTNTDPANSSGHYAKNFITTFIANLYGANLYVGFRLEKGVDTSESFTNESGESELAQQINQQLSSAREKKFDLAGGTGSGFIDGIMSGIKGVLSGGADAIGLGVIKDVMAGNGVIDFPDVWKSSSFAKSYNFNISLRSPYGDPYSILYNLYIPLCLLLAGAMPRAIGQAAYTGPFVLRAYCKGMFAVPLGMISQMTIKRGADQFGWSTARLPTSLDISFSIKDLSPAMYMAIADGGVWQALQQVFAANSTFQEYLMTLSGMGLSERLLFVKNLKRKATFLVASTRDTFLSPHYAGAVLGNSLPARLLTTFIPASRIQLGNN